MKKDISKALKLINEINERSLYLDLEKQIRNDNVEKTSEEYRLINALTAGSFVKQVYADTFNKRVVWVCKDGYFMVKCNILGLSHNLFIIKDNELKKSYRVRVNMSTWDMHGLGYKVQEFFGVR